MSNRRQITIICPVHNEETAIPRFYDRLHDAVAPLRERYQIELLFSNNGSTDESLRAIHKLREQDSSVHVLSLARNFGYEASIATALRHARGEAMVIIDVDCEDPPELIPQFVSQWEQGHDVVYGKRDQRAEFIGMHLARKAFYRLNRMVADSDIVLDMAEFFLISAAVRDAILANRSTKPFLRSEVAYAGFRRKGIPYERQQRIAGRSHYSLLRAINFGIGGILSSSTFPLRLPVYLFPLLVAANLGLMVVKRFEWLVVLDFLYVALFLAVLCIYLARTYKDVVQRPPAVVDWRQSTLPKPD
jgi:glycosyltransferase involved in cell wall biosynthesis